MVALMVGALLALGVGLLATGSGLDRDRAFYPVVTIVIASYYALFAVMGESSHALLLESLVGLASWAPQRPASSPRSGLLPLPWWAMGFSISSIAVSYPTPGCPVGGRSSASRTTSPSRHTWHGSLVPDDVVLQPSVW